MNDTTIDVLAAYREHKQKAEQLMAEARTQLQARYNAALAEAAQVQAEFKTNFNELPALPPIVKTFTLAKTDQPKPAATQSEAAARGKKIGGLRRSLNAAVRKQDTAKVQSISLELKALGIDTGLLATTEPATNPVPDFSFVQE